MDKKLMRVVANLLKTQAKNDRKIVSVLEPTDYVIAFLQDVADKTEDCTDSRDFDFVFQRLATDAAKPYDILSTLVTLSRCFPDQFSIWVNGILSIYLDDLLFTPTSSFRSVGLEAMFIIAAENSWVTSSEEDEFVERLSDLLTTRVGLMCVDWSLDDQRKGCLENAVRAYAKTPLKYTHIQIILAQVVNMGPSFFDAHIHGIAKIVIDVFARTRFNELSLKTKVSRLVPTNLTILRMRSGTYKDDVVLVFGTDSNFDAHQLAFDRFPGLRDGVISVFEVKHPQLGVVVRCASNGTFEISDDLSLNKIPGGFGCRVSFLKIQDF